MPTPKSETIHSTVSNDGPEPLIDIEVGDQLDSGAGAITGLVCTFPDASTGTTWAPRSRIRSTLSR